MASGSGGLWGLDVGGLERVVVGGVEWVGLMS